MTWITLLLNSAAYGTHNLVLRIIAFFKQVQTLSIRTLFSNPYIFVCVGLIFPTWLDTEMTDKELSFYWISFICSKWQFYQKRSFIHCDPWNTFVKGSEIRPSKLCLFGLRIILGWGYLKRSKCKERLSLNSLYLHKDRSSKKDSIVINSLQGSFINQKKTTLTTRD